MRPRILIPALGLLLLPAWFAGCFTEVGNAEDENLVSGEFKIDYSPDAKPLEKAAAALPIPDSILITQFYLEIREVELRAYDSVNMRTIEHHLWKEDSATLPVDFTGRDTSATLPVQKVGSFPEPDNLVLQCVVPKQAVLRADTVDFDSFSDKGYIKGKLGSGRNAREFLFQLPENREIHLQYSQAALKHWYWDNAYHCEFVFFATKWIAGAGLDKAEIFRDKTGEPLLIFGSGHNPELYTALVDRFYKSFNTLTVFAEVGH
jgi:hypothetical protein